jgi:hypothetical protein
MATSFYLRYPASGGASSNAANGTTGTTAPTTATEVGFVDGSGNLQPFSGTSASSGPNVTVSNTSTNPVPILNNDVVATGTITTQNLNGNTGTGTVGSYVAVSLNGQNTVAVQITGSYSSSFVVQGTVDGTNWVNYTFAVQTGSTTNVAPSASISTAFVGIMQVQCSGLSSLRIVASNAITGSATVTLRASVANDILTYTQLATGGNTLGNVFIVSPQTVTDVASAAITTTTTTATLTPTVGFTFDMNVVVTAVSGTNPTMSIAVQESADGGTNWYTVYTFPLITTTGSFVSPLLVQTGTRVRYVQTITGTTPSFTRSIFRNPSAEGSTPPYRNYIDTSIDPTTTNSTTASVFVENLNTYSAIINQGTGGSGVTFALDGSDDNVNWILGVTTATGVVGGSSPVGMSYSGLPFRYVRVRTVTGVASATISYVSIVGSISSVGPLGQQVMANSRSVAIASDQTSIPINSPDLTATGSINALNVNGSIGTGTAGSYVAMNVSGQSVVTIQATGTFVATIAPQTTVDGTNWVTCPFLINASSSTAAPAGALSGTGMYQVPVSGALMFRVVSTVYTSGAAVITMHASSGAPILNYASIGPSSNNIGNLNLIPVSTGTDVASSAITTTTTSANLTPASGTTYSTTVIVTAVSGTNPTLSLAIQESADTVNWFTVYVFPTITAVGNYNSPLLVQRGRVLRYVQTIGGTTPSFTRSVVRSQSNQGSTANYTNFVDTSIVPATTNSTTASVFVENTNTYTAIVNQGAGGSAVTFALDGSDDNVNWVQGLTTVAGVIGGATPVAMVYSGAAFRYIRARVVAGVASTTINYITLIGSMGGWNAAASGGGASTISPSTGALTNSSGTTSATPSTSTTLSSAKSRKYLFIQNPTSNTVSLWINFTSAATASQPSIQLLPGGSFVQESSFVSNELVTVLSTVASSPYIAKEA